MLYFNRTLTGKRLTSCPSQIIFGVENSVSLLASVLLSLTHQDLLQLLLLLRVERIRLISPSLLGAMRIRFPTFRTSVFMRRLLADRLILCNSPVNLDTSSLSRL